MEPASSFGDVQKIADSELTRALQIAAGDLRFLIERYLRIEDRLDTNSYNAPAWRLDTMDMLARLIVQFDAHMEDYPRSYNRGGKE